MRLLQYFGHLTNDIVYKRLAPRVLEELQKNNPKADDGRKNKLLQHLGMVVGLMKVSNDWGGFMNLLTRVTPAYDETSLF